MVNNIKFSILATDVVIFTLDKEGLKTLLIKASSPSFLGQKCFPGGLVKPSETLKLAAKRIISRYINPDKVYLEQLDTFGDPTRDPGGRVVSVSYMGLVPQTEAEKFKNVEWVLISQVPPLAYDHNEILEVALERLREKIGYTNIIYTLMPEEFTLSELQRAYELILKRKVDKRNFRKKIRDLDLLKKLNKKRRGDANRPAQLYRFLDKRLKIVEIL